MIREYHGLHLEICHIITKKTHYFCLVLANPAAIVTGGQTLKLPDKKSTTITVTPCNCAFINSSIIFGVAEEAALFFMIQKKRHQVSHSTTNHIIHSFYESQTLNFHYLPENLCFNEFKSIKSSQGSPTMRSMFPSLVG